MFIDYNFKQNEKRGSASSTSTIWVGIIVESTCFCIRQVWQRSIIRNNTYELLRKSISCCLSVKQTMTKLCSVEDLPTPEDKVHTGSRWLLSERAKLHLQFPYPHPSLQPSIFIPSRYVFNYRNSAFQSAAVNRCLIIIRKRYHNYFHSIHLNENQK